MQVRLARSDMGMGKSGSMADKRTRIWVSATRRLKLLVQDVLETVFILLWVQGSFFLRMQMWIQIRIDRVTTALCCALLLHVSTNYVRPVSPLLTLVALPEAGFT